MRAARAGHPTGFGRHPGGTPSSALAALAMESRQLLRCERPCDPVTRLVPGARPLRVAPGGGAQRWLSQASPAGTGVPGWYAKRRCLNWSNGVWFAQPWGRRGSRWGSAPIVAITRLLVLVPILRVGGSRLFRLCDNPRVTPLNSGTAGVGVRVRVRRRLDPDQPESRRVVQPARSDHRALRCVNS